MAFILYRSFPFCYFEFIFETLLACQTLKICFDGGIPKFGQQQGTI